MADIQNTSPNTRLAHILYALYAAGFFFGITAVIAVIINYVKRTDVKGTYLESHFNWQIKTFWVALIVGVIGIVTCLFLIGFAILFGLAIWYLYRIIKGWIVLNDGKAL